MRKIKINIIVDKNMSKFVHNSSIYAGYTPLGGLFTKKMCFNQKFQNNEFFEYFIYNGAPF